MENAMDFISAQLGKEVVVHTNKLETYRGILLSFDVYANISLENVIVNEKDRIKYSLINGIQVTHIVFE